MMQLSCPNCLLSILLLRLHVPWKERLWKALLFLLMAISLLSLQLELVKPPILLSILLLEIWQS